MNKKLKTIGILLSIAYIFIVPIANFVREDLITKENSTLFLFFSFLFSLLFFNLINIRNIKKIYTKSIDNKFDFIKINLFILILWSSSFLAPTYFGAPYSVLMIFSTVGILGTFSRIVKNEDKYGNLQRYFAIALYSTSIILILTHVFSAHVYKGFLLSLTSGIFTFLYIRDSQKFSFKSGLQASEILAVRYWGVIVILPFFCINHGYSLPSHLNLNLFLLCTFVAFISMVLPVYFNQKSLYYIDYKLSSAILSFVPFVAWVFCFLQDKNEYKTVLISLICLFTFSGGFLSAFLGKSKFIYSNNIKLNS